MITITNSRSRSYPEKVIQRGSNVYAESNADKLIDAFFDEHKIWALNFKCKIWSRMKAMATKLNVLELRKVFGDECEIKWSDKTGCTCGCSPGYRVRKIPAGSCYNNKDVCVKIQVDTDELAKKLPTFKADLLKEIESHS